MAPQSSVPEAENNWIPSQLVIVTPGALQLSEHRHGRFGDFSDSFLSSGSRSRQTQNISGPSNSHQHAQVNHKHINNGDVTKTMEIVPYHLGIPSGVPSISDFIPNLQSDDFQSNLHCDNWDSSSQIPNSTADQALPNSSHYNSNLWELQDVMSGLEYAFPNDVSDQLSRNIDGDFTPVFQTPAYNSPGQESITEREFFNPLAENQNLPQCIANSSLSPIDMNATINPSLLSQDIYQDSSIFLNNSPSLFESNSLSIIPKSPGLMANADLYANYRNATQPMGDLYSSLDQFAAVCYDNSPLTVNQRISILDSKSACNEKRNDNSGSHTRTNSTNSGYQRERPILPAPAKSYPRTPHDSIRLAYLPKTYGLHELQPRRSDRRQLTEPEKKYVREVREIGSCVVCSLKRQKCDKKEICESCQKMVQNPNMDANHICIRGGILNFRQGILDFFDISDRIRFLPNKLQDSWRTIMIGDRFKSNGTNSVFFTKNVSLTVQVRQHETCKLSASTLWSEGSVRSRVGTYAIDPSTLPTALELDEWGRNLLLEYFELPNFQPNIMDKFLFAYLKYLTIRLRSLSSWLYPSHPIISIDNVNSPSLPLSNIYDDRVETQLSGVARLQLQLIAAKEFEATEKEILFITDSLTRTVGGNPEHAIILGLCLRRIALLYRFSSKRYKKFVTLRDIIRRKEKFKAMYEALTTAYSLVYSGAKSPYSKKWLVNDHLAAFGNDKKLADIFVEAIRCDKEFCQSNWDDEDDIHLKKLFWERKERGGQRTKT